MSAQTYTAVCGMITCVSGGQYVETADYLAEKTRADALAAALEGFVENTDVPAPNCACHINPPCPDCTDHGSLRELIANGRAALHQARKERA